MTGRLRPHLLRAFRDEHGRELLDLPDAPRPDPGTPAPPRFLPEYDNVLLSHADRGRIYAGGYRPAPHAGKGGFIGNVLIDGFFRATYTITRRRGQATLLLTPFAHLSGEDTAALTEEGAWLLAFAAADAGTHDVRFAEETRTEKRERPVQSSRWTGGITYTRTPSFSRANRS